MINRETWKEYVKASKASEAKKPNITPKNIYTCYFDGSSIANKPSTYGFAVYVSPLGRCMVRQSGYGKIGDTSSQAEWHALRMLAWWIRSRLRKRRDNEIIICGDFTSIIDIMSGKGKPRSYSSKRNRRMIREKLSIFSNVEYRWIPRKENIACHDLAFSKHSDNL